MFRWKTAPWHDSSCQSWLQPRIMNNKGDSVELDCHGVFCVPSSVRLYLSFDVIVGGFCKHVKCSSLVAKRWRSRKENAACASTPFDAALPPQQGTQSKGDNPVNPERRAVQQLRRFVTPVGVAVTALCVSAVVLLVVAAFFLQARAAGHTGAVSRLHIGCWGQEQNNH